MVLVILIVPSGREHMHSTCRTRTSQLRVPSEYIKINIKDILYSPELLQASPELVAEAIGVKILCSVHCWVSGRIPHDLCAISRLLRVPEKTIARSWPIIGAEFEPIGESHYILPSLEAERQEAVSLSENRRQSAYGRWSADTSLDDSSKASDGAQTVEKTRKSFSNRERNQFGSIDLSNNPTALGILSAWNLMAVETGGVIASG